MKSDAIAYGVAGILFGLIAGWVIGTQQAAMSPLAVPQAPAAATAAPTMAPGATGAARQVDENQVSALKSTAEREASNPGPRVQLGNVYFDAGRYEEAIPWYSQALKLAPKDVNVSTDLGVSYFYLNRPDEALKQLAYSLELDPKHTKTLLNLGVVKARGKQDLKGAESAWEQVVQLAPGSEEGQQAKVLLDMLKAHPAQLSSPTPAS